MENERELREKVRVSDCEGKYIRHQTDPDQDGGENYNFADVDNIIYFKALFIFFNHIPNY